MSRHDSRRSRRATEGPGLHGRPRNHFEATIETQPLERKRPRTPCVIGQDFTQAGETAIDAVQHDSNPQPTGCSRINCRGNHLQHARIGQRKPTRAKAGIEVGEPIDVAFKARISIREEVLERRRRTLVPTFTEGVARAGQRCRSECHWRRCRHHDGTAHHQTRKQDKTHQRPLGIPELVNRGDADVQACYASTSICCDDTWP
jgi:hypothetical protein